MSETDPYAPQPEAHSRFVREGTQYDGPNPDVETPEEPNVADVEASDVDADVEDVEDVADVDADAEDEDEDADVDVEDAPEYDASMKKEVLVDAAKKAGLPTKGTKAELAERLNAK